MTMTNVDPRPVVIRPPATLAGHNRQAFKLEVLARIEGGGPHVVLDLAETGYVDAAGLGVLVSLSKRAKDAGGSLALANLNEDLQQLLELTRLVDVLQVVELIRCAHCGDSFDLRFLDQVLYHEQVPHGPIKATGITGVRVEGSHG